MDKMQKKALDDWIQRDDLDYYQDMITCDLCGMEVESEDDLSSCPNCHRNVCDNCSEGLDDLFYDWCDGCMGRC